MSEITIKNERPYECCNVHANIEIVTDSEKPELEIQKCRVCGRKHYRLIVETAKFKMVMQEA